MDPPSIWRKQQILQLGNVVYSQNYFFSDLDSRFSLVGSTTSLRITNIQEEDAGVYQCRAANTEDSLDASAMVQIQVFLF